MKGLIKYSTVNIYRSNESRSSRQSNASFKTKPKVYTSTRPCIPKYSSPIAGKIPISRMSLTKTGQGAEGYAHHVLKAAIRPRAGGGFPTIPGSSPNRFVPAYRVAPPNPLPPPPCPPPPLPPPASPTTCASASPPQTNCTTGPKPSPPPKSSCNRPSPLSVP